VLKLDKVRNTDWSRLRHPDCQLSGCLTIRGGLFAFRESEGIRQLAQLNYVKWRSWAVLGWFTLRVL